MTIAIEGAVPETPICGLVGEPTRPCPFAGVCHEPRQRVQSGYRKIEHKWVLLEPPMWGRQCWAYEWLSDARKDLLPAIAVDDVERAAIQDDA